MILRQGLRTFDMILTRVGMDLDLMGIWKSSGTAELAAPEVLQAAFIRAEVQQVAR